MIYNKIKSDIIEAMREKNTTLKSALKQVQDKAQAIAKEKKSEVTDEIVTEAINKELKQLNQTLDAIKSKPDSDLFKETTEKVNILKEYLPKQLSEEEIIVEIQRIISDNPEVPTGKLTGIVMKTLKGKADNKLIKEVFDKII